MSKPISDPVFDIGRDLQRAYDEGYKQGRYDEKVAAIDALKEHRALYCDNTPDTFSKLSYAEKSRVDELDTAIATLVNLPFAQPEPKQSENGSKLFGNSEKLDDKTTDDLIRRLELENLLVVAQDQDFITLEEYEKFWDLVSRAPSAEPHWIPCSEGLPEYRKLVDVTTRDLRVKLAYLDSIKEDGTDELWIIPLEDAECALWNIVAWKPRPEPWKEADDDIR